MNQLQEGNPQAFSIHCTNVTGIGAIHVVSELLPLLEKYSGGHHIKLFLPQSGPLSQYKPHKQTTSARIYRRLLPRLISRAIECLFMVKKFNQHPPLLVLGDIPIRGCHDQVVFLHQSHIIPPSINPFSKNNLSFIISRWLFRSNLRFVRRIIVQTETMQDALHQAYPETQEKTVVITQPPPSWIKSLSYTSNKSSPHDGLILFYPAAYYPHKNHKIFNHIASSLQERWPVKEAVLTIEPTDNPNPSLKWLRCTGILSPQQCMEQYSRCHALIFPSFAESYGLPLVEAMTLGLPIVAADLPYARMLCKDQAIYFDPNNTDTLKDALIELRQRLLNGWQPDWSQSLQNIPSSWDSVAQMTLDVLTKP